MERLTETFRNGDGSGISKGSLIDRPGKGLPSATALAMVTKLADYEDLEELIGIPLKELAEIINDNIPDDCKKPHRAIILTDGDVDRWNGYKNADEQGLLLRLTCKVGDTAWYVDNDDDNYPIEIRITHIEVKGNYILYYAEEKEDCGTFGFDSDDFGKTVFLTQAEAEQKLKKME